MPTERSSLSMRGRLVSQSSPTLLHSTNKLPHHDPPTQPGQKGKRSTPANVPRHTVKEQHCLHRRARMSHLNWMHCSCSSSSFGYSHQWSPQRIFLLLLFLSTVSSSVTSTSAMSSFTTSINLLFGLPHFLFPGNSILSILLPIYPSSFLRRCPYHLSLASRVFSPNFPTCAVPLMYSFLILSILVTPNENRNIFNSATSISASCLFVSATVSNPYNIAGLSATL